MEVILSAKARRFLDRLNEPAASKIARAIKTLTAEPIVGDIVKLSGRAGYRLRAGNARVLYGIENEKVIVTSIGWRGQVYKGKGKHK
jgi:mRNA-degrading endonuclease RelE of RelBE toxin-antitoxin system